VQESRDDDWIKLKTKWAALEAPVGNPKRCQLSPHRSQSRNHMKLPQSDKLVVEREKIADYLLSPSHRYGGSKARFFGQYGFDIAACEALAQALREHGRTYEIARERQTGFGPRFIVEGNLNTPSGQRPRVRRSGSWMLAQLHRD